MPLNRRENVTVGAARSAQHAHRLNKEVVEWIKGKNALMSILKNRDLFLCYADMHVSA